MLNGAGKAAGLSFLRDAAKDMGNCTANNPPRISTKPWLFLIALNVYTVTLSLWKEHPQTKVTLDTWLLSRPLSTFQLRPGLAQRSLHSQQPLLAPGTSPKQPHTASPQRCASAGIPTQLDGAIPAQKDVVAFDVSVDHLLGMKESQALQALPGEKETGGQELP